MLCFPRISCLAALGFLVAGPVAAQNPVPSWRPSARISAPLHYDDNPFLLTPAARSAVGDPSADDIVSGRFRDMASATDVIALPAVQVGLQGPGLFGRLLELSADVTYELNVENTRRRHAELRFGIEQAFPKGGRVRLRADWRPSYFSKNYLSDGVDLSGDGNITPDERVYRPGTSHEVDLTVNVRRRLLKARRDRPLEVTGQIEVGYFTRTYEAPFTGRDRHGPGAGAALSFDVGRNWTIGVDYTFQSLTSNVSREVQILDETQFGVDFNGVNGAADTEARAFELVDRSRVEHEVRTSVAARLSRPLTLELAYARRMRAFGSTQPFDIANRDRHDSRNELEAGLAIRVTRGLRLGLSGAFAKQSTNRSGDPGSTGDVADYSRRLARVVLEYRF